MTTTEIRYEMVVGLEVHVELATATKLFSGSPNRFGDEPNTNIDPVTLGLPGALPVLNRQAVELAMRIGVALNCTIQPCVFHRKNYFYPDMPKAYQISQYDVPLNVDGWLDLPDGSRVGIERAHLEEDTGKSTHFGGADCVDPGLVGNEWHQVGFEEVAIVVRVLFRSQRVGAAITLVPVPGLLAHDCPAPEEVDLPPRLELDRPSEGAHGVEVLDLAASAVRLDRPVDADVGIDAHRTLLHLGV